MNDIKNGGPAFPGGVNQTYTDRAHEEPTQYGLTIRDYFAAYAMQAIVSNHDLLKIMDSMEIYKGHIIKDIIAKGSYSLADAMLAERNKEENNE